MAKKTHEEPKAELKKAMGRQIALVKDKAREALPNGSAEELAKKANEIAPTMGFEPDFTAERFTDKPASTPRSPKPPATPTASAEPSMSEYKDYRYAVKEEGKPEHFRQAWEVLKPLAARVGGFARLEAFLKMDDELGL